MTIIAAKDNPPSKPFKGSILEKEGTWWVAKTKPRQEKAFAFDLLNKGTDYYLPYYEKKIKRSDGKFRKSYLPLFPSYVPFISDNPSQILSNERVSTILPIYVQDRFQIQLQYILQAFSSAYEVIPFMTYSSFKVGDSIKVKDGPCKGLLGKIINIKNEDYLVFSIDLMGCAMVSISNAHIEVINEKSNIISKM